MKKELVYFFLIGCFLNSCDSEKSYYHTFPNKNWISKEKILFNFSIEDSLSDYSKSITIRHTTDYKYQNIILLTNLYYQNKHLKKDTLNVFLADDSGKWKGVGKTKKREYSHRFYSIKKYKKGDYSLELELAMRDINSLEIDTLKNVSDIVFSITKINE